MGLRVGFCLCSMSVLCRTEVGHFCEHTALVISLLLWQNSGEKHLEERFMLAHSLWGISARHGRRGVAIGNASVHGGRSALCTLFA